MHSSTSKWNGSVANNKDILKAVVGPKCSAKCASKKLIILQTFDTFSVFFTHTHTHTHTSFTASPCSLKGKYAWFQKEGEKEFTANCQLEGSGWVTL
jgi:hypothetical protein